MTCPTTLTCSRYADGALPDDEAISVEQHLTGCVSCQAVVEALGAEGMALRSAMQTAEATGVVPAFVPRPTIPKLLSYFGWAALAAWVVNVAWMSLASTTILPSWLGWLAPDLVDTGVNLSINLMMLLVREGGDLVTGIAQSLQWIALVGAALTGLWLLARRQTRQTTSLCFSVCLQLGLATFLVTAAAPGQAFEIRRDDNRVVIPAGETIDDTLIVVAEDVVVEGTITGDLIAFGEEVRVTGRVGGMLLSGAETLSVEGEVTGSILGMGETVDIRGATLGMNLYGIGETVTVHENTTVAGNTALAGAETEMRGEVGRDLLALTRKLSLIGNVAGNLQAYAERVELAGSARVGGDLKATLRSNEDLLLADGATIEGATDLSTWPEEPNKYTTFEYYLGETLQFLAAFVTGLALLYLFPALGQTRLEGETLTVIGAGAVALVATPVLAVIVTVTLIGAPLGMVTFLLWLVALYAAGIIAAGHVGRMLLSGDDQNRAVPLAVGLLILLVLGNVPLLGGLVRLIATVVGLGMIVQWLRGLWADRSA